MQTIQWKIGTAFDFFISLTVLHQPAIFGLRPSWAAGVRQRLSTPKREFLEKLHSFSGVPLAWLSRLPEPGDACTALQAIASLLPIDQLMDLTLTAETSPRVRNCLQSIARRGFINEKETLLLKEGYRLRDAALPPKSLSNLVEAWSDPQKTADLYLAALKDYYQFFFAEEEIRIRPALRAGLERGQALATRLSLDALIEDLSHGIRFTPMDQTGEIILAPSYWSSPLIFYSRFEPGKLLLLFGSRPELESIVPGAGPPPQLVSTLKVLADPTRLRILRFLADQPLCASELARQLRLRLPTVTHHLRLLRLAGLVLITVDETEKRYATRLEILDGIQHSLLNFIQSEE
jgi:DNA-binding transcriptional ArsR family regulator